LTEEECFEKLFPESTNWHCWREKPRTKTRSSRFLATPKKDPPAGAFRKWAQAFFLSLQKEKEATNPAPFELLCSLSDDGRMEVALSIYNYLRPELWKEFSRDRQWVGQRVKKMLSRPATTSAGRPRAICNSRR
jgi:hypothetical protein